MVVKQNIAVRVGGVLVSAYSAASSFNTDAIDMRKYNGGWTFQVSRSASDGTTSVTIQCSQDGTNWVNYSSLSTDVDIPCIIEQSEFKPNYLRIVYTETGSTSGTITMWFTEVT